MPFTIGSVVGFLKLDTKDFDQGTMKAGQRMEALGSKMMTVGATMTAAITLPIVGVGTAALKMSNDFNKSMANVATLIPGNTRRLKDLRGEVQRLAVAHGKDTQDLVGGLYQTISAFGDDAAETVKVLEINSRAATAGLATTLDAINLTSAVTKAYGDTSAKAVEHVSDLAFQTVKLGQTTFPELAAAIGNVAPVAAQLNVSQEELSAGFATLTGVTGNTATVSTQLAAVLRAMIKPTEGMQAAMGKLGFSSAAAMVQELGMVGALEKLIGTTDGSEKAIGELFGRVEGMNAVFALTGAQSDTFKDKLAAMMDVVGKSAEAFKEQTEGVNAAGFQWDQFKQRIVVVAQNLGDKLTPAFMSFLDVAEPMVGLLADLVDWFGKWPKPLQAAAIAILGIVAAIGPLIAFVGTMAFSIGSMMTLWGQLGLTAVGVASVFSGVLLPALAVVATAIAAYKLTDWILEWTGVREGVDMAAKSLLGVRDVLPPTAQQTQAMAQASEIAGREIKTWSEATQILNEHISKLQKESGQTTGAVVALSQTVQEQAKSLQEQARNLLDAAGKTDILAEASSLAGKDITSAALAAEILAENARRMELKKRADEMKAFAKEARALGKSFTTVALRDEMMQLNMALQEVHDKGWTLTDEAIERINERIDDFESQGGKVTDRLKEFKDRFADLKAVMNPLIKQWWNLNEAMRQASMGPVVERWSDVLLTSTPQVQAVGDETDDVTEKTVDWSRALQDVANAFQVLGVEADSTLGRIIAGMVVAAQAGQAFKAGLDAFEAGDRAGGIGQMGAAGAQGFGAVMSATGSGSRGSRAAGGASAGAAFGGQIVPGWGHAVGAGVGALVGWLRGAGPAEAMQAVGSYWGEQISQGLAEAISKTADDLDLTKMQASFLHLGDILRDQGGITEDNFRAATFAFDMLVRNIENGTIGIKEGLEAVNDAFFEMVDGLEEMGLKGRFEIGSMINSLKELGLVTDEIQEFIKQKAQEVLTGLGAYFDWLNNKQEITASNAKAAGFIMAQAFNAAFEAAGSLLGAINLLPDSFGELLAKVREVVGEENELLNALTRYYNFAKANEEVLGAIDGLSSAFQALAEMGLVTKDNINDFADAFKDTFNELLAATGDETMALAAMGPQIGMLLEAFHNLGMQVPPWLQEMADAAEAAGVSLEPPEGIADIFAEIRDLLRDIRNEMLGIKDIGNPFGDVAPPPGWSPNVPAPEDIDAQGGLLPTYFPRGGRINVHPGEVGAVIPAGQVNIGSMGGAGGGKTENHYHIDNSLSTTDPRELAERLADIQRRMTRNNTGESISDLHKRQKRSGHS